MDSIGRSGGLALLWDRSVQCSVFDFDQNHIDVHMLQNNIPKWRLTGFYGYPERSQRRESWKFPKTLWNISHFPWVLLGDYNDMLSEGGKSGPHKHPQLLFVGFR